MLILARRTDYPDHDMHAPIARLCNGTWWFACDHTETHTVKGKKVKEQCPRRHRVSCAGGTHVPLDVAIATVKQAGWQQAPPADGGGWRCSMHRLAPPMEG